MTVYVISIDRNDKSLLKARKKGYISGKEFQEQTGLSERRMYYWVTSGVFGEPVYAGSGHSLMWHKDVVPIVLILNELALELGKFNNTSTDLLRRIVANFNHGEIQFSEHIRLEWDTEEELSKRRHPVYGLKLEDAK